MKKQITPGGMKERPEVGKVLVVGILASMLVSPMAFESAALADNFLKESEYCVRCEESLQKAEKTEEGLMYCLRCGQILSEGADSNLKHDKTANDRQKLSVKDEQLLKDLQFDGYRFMKLPEFRDQIYNATDTAEYQELFSRLTDNNELINTISSPDLLSFVRDVLMPLMSDTWLNQEFSGEVLITPVDSYNAARIEYTFEVEIARPKVIRVGDYQDGNAAVPQAFKDLFLGKVREELQDIDAVNRELQTFFDDWIQYTITPEMWITDLTYVYFSPEEVNESLSEPETNAGITKAMK